MIRLSIIIPVYNVEQYLAKCLNSVLQQDISQDQFEIIVVNDSSPDGSLSIAEDYASYYDNIKVFTRPNGGLSAARNTGLEHAIGKYVWFIDSDDWVEANCIGSLLTYAEDNHLDVHCFGLQLAFEDGKTEKYNISCEKHRRDYSGDEFICKVGMPPAAWAALYRRDFLLKNKLRFIEGILHEDQEFTPRAYFLAKRIAYTDMIVYNYLQRTGSIMKSGKSVKRCKDLLTVADSLYSFMKLNVSETSCCYPYFQNVVNFCFSQSLAYYTKKAFPLAEYKRRAYYPLQNTSGLSLKYRIANLSLNLYLILLSFKNR